MKTPQQHTLQYHIIIILKIACFCLFAGRAWQHLIWDIPIRSLLWDQDLMEGIITSLTGMTWQEYATGTTQDTFIQSFKMILGGFYASCALLCFYINDTRKWIGKLFLFATFLLTFLAFLYYKEKFFHLGQLLEYSIQISTPILLYLFFYTKTTNKQLIFFGKIAIAFAFTCHGLYAIGYYPQPGHFVDMVIRGIFLEEPAAKIFLKAVGFIDIAISIGLFLPVVWRASVWYAIIWGLLTAIARVTTNFYWDFPLQSLNQWLPEMLYRIPHGIIPLFVLLLANARNIKRNEKIRFMDLIKN